MSAYVLGYGGFVLLGGRAADLLGRRRMFLAWLVVFIVFSGLGGLATEGWMLILARFLTGVAAGFMSAVGEVIASRSGDVAVGTTVSHFLGWREYAVLDAAAATVIDPAIAPPRPTSGYSGRPG